MDHAGTFRHAENRDELACDFDLRGSCFGASVGGENGMGEGVGGSLRGGARREQAGELADDFIGGKRDADDAGGRWEHFLWAQS